MKRDVNNEFEDVLRTVLKKEDSWELMSGIGEVQSKV